MRTSVLGCLLDNTNVGGGLYCPYGSTRYVGPTCLGGLLGITCHHCVGYYLGYVRELFDILFYGLFYVLKVVFVILSIGDMEGICIIVFGHK